MTTLAVQRLADAGRLRDGSTVERAAQWAWSRSHLDAWHQLVVDCGWPPEEFAERTIRSISAELVAGSPRGGGRRRSRAR